jgi:hypothetical protein
MQLGKTTQLMAAWNSANGSGFWSAISPARTAPGDRRVGGRGLPEQEVGGVGHAGEQHQSAGELAESSHGEEDTTPRAPRTGCVAGLATG